MLTQVKPLVVWSNSARDLPARHSFTERRLFFALSAIVLVYAFLAGLATVGDPDFGWQLARGRWIAQHHHVFTGDVLSYTIPGADAVYPAIGGVLLYWLYVLGGYTMLSWACGIACAGTVALLMRRGNAVTAGIAILFVPFIAMRTVPRSELFAIVLFAAFVSILWENFETGRAALWLLPLLMVIWVNVHLSFISGFSLLGAFVAVELLEWPFGGERRTQAMRRLKREVPWFLATVAATIINPWGWNLYKETTQYTQAALDIYVNEWAPLHWNWTSPFVSFSLRNDNDIAHVIFVIVVLAIVAALLQRRLGAAFLLLAALVQVIRHMRFIALASCMLIVVGGSVLYSAMPWVRSRIASPRARAILAGAAALVFAAIAVVRAADVVTNYHDLVQPSLSTFGTGLSGWFPRGAAEFIRRQNLPDQVFNTYNVGGYILWALGPERRDYVDGREIPFGAPFLRHEAELRNTPLDSDPWRREADRYGINTIVFALTLDEISLERLNQDCRSVEWRPVYLDEDAIVLLRRTPANEELIRRFEVDCSTAPLPRASLPLNAASFNQWVNAATVLAALHRNSEALAAMDTAMRIFPDNAHARWYRGQILYALQRHSDAEADWQRALALSPREVPPWGSLHEFQAMVWKSLAEMYHQDGRSPEARHALEAILRLSSNPAMKAEALTNLGALSFAAGQNAEAEKQWLAALGLNPNQSAVWFSLADLYQHAGHPDAAIRALKEAVRLSPDATLNARAQIRLAQLYLRSRQPEQALHALDDADRTAPPELAAASSGRSFAFDVAQGRAASWLALGDLKQATSFQEQAVKLDPDAADAWLHLAKLYQREGRLADQQRAEERSKAMAGSQ